MAFVSYFSIVLIFMVLIKLLLLFIFGFLFNIIAFY